MGERLCRIIQWHARDELLNHEIFLSFEEACWLIDRWRLDYNHHRIHSSLDYQTPVAFAAGCVLPASATPQPPKHSRITNPNSLSQLGEKNGGQSLFIGGVFLILLLGWAIAQSALTWSRKPNSDVYVVRDD